MLAIGDPVYGRWAANMAMSIKYHSDTPVLLVREKTATSTIHAHHLQLFDEIIEIDPEDCRDGTRLNPAKAKLNLYKYLPGSALYLDADGILVTSPDALLKECKKALHTQVERTTGKNDKQIGWAPLEIVWDKYGLKPKAQFQEINSSFLWIKKGKTSSAIFQKALKALEDPIPPSQFYQKWGNTNAQPDELYLSIAMAQSNHDASLPMTPVYFRPRSAKGPWISMDELQTKYLVLGCWGDARYNHKSVVHYYDQLTNRYSQKIIGIRQEFKYHHLIKRKFVRHG